MGTFGLNASVKSEETAEHLNTVDDELPRAIPKSIVHLSIIPIFLCNHADAQVSGDLTELFDGGFEVFDDFLSEDIEIVEIIGFFQALVSQTEDVKLALSRF